MLSGCKPGTPEYLLNIFSYSLMCSNFSILEAYFPEKKVFHCYFLGAKVGLRENLPIRVTKLISAE